jgi:hypothetical protein
VVSPREEQVYTNFRLAGGTELIPGQKSAWGSAVRRMLTQLKVPRGTTSFFWGGRIRISVSQAIVTRYGSVEVSEYTS